MVKVENSQILDDFPKKTEVCSKHGEYQSKNFYGGLWSKCPKCTDELDFLELKQEQEKKDKIWTHKLEQAGILARFRQSTLENYIVTNIGQKKALNFAMEYVKDMDNVCKTGRSAMFIGKVGTGKNHLALSICTEYLKKGKTVKYTTVTRVIRTIRESWEKNSDTTEGQVIRDYVNYDLLVMGEVGIQYGTNAERILLFDIFDERYERMKPSIILTNKSLGDVKSYIGEQVVDRFCEGDGEIVVFNWQSYRK